MVSRQAVVGLTATMRRSDALCWDERIGVPVALTGIAFLLGLLVIPFAVETRGKPLPT